LRKIETLAINEIFFSIQGESSYAGVPMVFVRLAGCDLRCSYCDTQYAYSESEQMSIEAIIHKVESYNCAYVEITGGEPLLQKNVYLLIDELVEKHYRLLMETGGHLDVSRVNKKVKKIVDIKCPASGEADKVRWENLPLLTPNDELKFVIADRDDYLWAKDVIRQNKKYMQRTILFSPVFGKQNSEELVNWILEDRLPVRFQLQLHKYIWPADKRGV
jgi:7-carboxy-7-deazaguanine synthase